MKIRYSTNWMGPVSLNWYRDRGLTTIKIITLEEDSVISGLKAGDHYESEEITVSYSTGRIDVMGNDDPYGDEIGVPPMHSEDWVNFGAWLDTFETDAVWTLDQLVELYERTNSKIRWAPPKFDIK
jgi:hypothetical protein